MKEKVAIVVAPVGALTSRENCPYIALTAEEQAEEAQRCHNVGASIYHVHVRDEKTGANTGDVSAYSNLVKRVRGRSSILIQIGGAIGPRRDPETGMIHYPFGEEQRMALLDTNPAPDMISLKIGSVELKVPGPMYSSVTVSNPPDFIRKYTPTVFKRKICLELEIFDVSCLHNTALLSEEGVFGKDGLMSPGCYLHYVMGHGGQPATLKQLMYMVEEGTRLFPKSRWCVCAAGKDSFPIITMALLLGSNIVRCGVEDSPHLSNGERAESNAQIVENVVKIARELGRDIATVDEAKEMLMPK